MTIGQRIAELRKQHNLSQEALGEALGVSRQAISKWESDAALPEIDKLIALSRRFGVTVGYLLGVEDARAEAEAEQASAGPTEAEVLERYLNSLPKPKPRSKGRRVLLAVGLLLILIPLIGAINRLNERISNLYGTVTNLNSQVINMQYNLNDISGSISGQIKWALQQEYGLLASQSLELRSVDYGTQTAVVELSSVLKNWTEGLDSLNFYARLDDGSYLSCDWEEWDEAVCAYSARLTLPCTERNLTYYLATAQGTVCLSRDDYELCDLYHVTQPQGYCTTLINPVQRGLNCWLDLQIELPWQLPETMLKEFGTPTVQCWLVRNGQRLAEMSPENPLADNGDSWDCSFKQHDLLWSDLGITPEPGDRFSLEYEVRFENGHICTGTGDELVTLDSEGHWQTEYRSE